MYPTFTIKYQGFASMDTSCDLLDYREVLETVEMDGKDVKINDTLNF